MILLLDARTGTKSRSAEPLVRDRMQVEDVYRLAELDLEPYAALHISGMVDQELLMRERDVISGFLDAGRVVVFCGHLLRPWLPAAARSSPRRSPRTGTTWWRSSRPIPSSMGSTPTT